MKRKSAFLKIRPRKKCFRFPDRPQIFGADSENKIDRPILIVFGREPETQVTTIFFLGLTRPNEINEANQNV